MLDKDTTYENQNVYKSIKFYNAIKKLVELGWVMKTKDRNDKRKVIYRLSLQGVLIANAFKRFSLV
jgi:DNA-binding MarR family transcriptional regulator